MTIRVLAFIGSLSWLSTLASAQMPGIEPEPCLPFEPDNSIELPDGPPGFDRIVVAELDGDRDPDGVVTVNGVATVLWNLAAYDASEPIQFPTQPAPTSVTGMAAFPGGGDDGRDAVVMADSRGLYMVTYGSTGFDEPTLLAGSPWTNARAIHVDDLDFNGQAEVIGLASNLRTLLLLFSSVPPTTLSVPLPYDGLDVAAVNWNYSGHRELCALTKKGLRVYSTSGALLANVSHNATAGCLARVRSSRVGEILAWTRPNGLGAHELKLTSALYNDVPISLSFTGCGETTPIQPTAILAGNYDDDPTNDELLLAHQAERTAIVLINRGSEAQAPTHFSTTDDELFDIVTLSGTPNDAGGVGVPAFAPVDVDGLPGALNPDDVVFPVNWSAQVHVFLGLPFLRNHILPVGQPGTSSDVIRHETEFHPETVTLEPDGLLRPAFKVLDRYATYDYIDIFVWREAFEGAGVDPDFVQHTRRGLLAGEPYQFLHLPFFPDEDCWAHSATDSPEFYVEMRFIKVGPPEVLSRAYFGGFRLQNCGPVVDDYAQYLVQLGIPGTAFGLNQNNGLPDPPSIGNGNTIGIYVPMSSLPPFAGTPERPPLSGAFADCFSFTPDEPE